MSELKAFDIVVAEEGYCEGIVKYRRVVYDKSEADKVIAELETKNASLTEELNEWVRSAANRPIIIGRLRQHIAVLDNELRHSNYKRCLAMAKWCERKRIDAANYRIPRQKWDFYDKWFKRWLALAEKFK